MNPRRIHSAAVQFAGGFRLPLRPFVQQESHLFEIKCQNVVAEKAVGYDPTDAEPMLEFCRRRHPSGHPVMSV